MKVRYQVLQKNRDKTVNIRVDVLDRCPKCNDTKIVDKPKSKTVCNCEKQKNSSYVLFRLTPDALQDTEQDKLRSSILTTLKNRIGRLPQFIRWL